MSFFRRKQPETVSSVSFARDAGSLGAFKEPGCAATVWQRSPEPEVLAWLAGLDPARLPKGRVVIHRDHVAATVAHFCEMAQTPQGPERTWLEADVVELAAAFTDLMDTPYLRLRLDVITTNACRKFHIDAIHARLVCTYRGTGTQYGIASAGEDPSRIFTVPTGSPILLRGTEWLDQPPSGLRHRSPPIEGTGETRLVLVIDPVFDPEDVD